MGSAKLARVPLRLCEAFDSRTALYFLVDGLLKLGILLIRNRLAFSVLLSSQDCKKKGVTRTSSAIFEPEAETLELFPYNRYRENVQ